MEDRIQKLEMRLSKLEIAEAVNHERYKNIQKSIATVEKQLSGMKTTMKTLVGFIIGPLAAGLIGWIVKGGLNL